MAWQPFQQLLIGSQITYTNNLPYQIQGVRIKTLSLELDGQLVTDLAQSQAVCLFSLSEGNGQSDFVLNDTFSLYPDNDYLIFSLNSNFFNSPRIGFKILDEFITQSPQWTIEIELYQFSNLSSISDILQFINGNTNNKIQLVLNALQNLDLSGLTNMDFTQLLADISTLLTDSNTQLLTDITSLVNTENSQLLTDINTHSDTNKGLIVTDINTHSDTNKTAITTDINSYADTNKTSIIADINTHSDTNKGLIITDINAHADTNKNLIITAINSINTGGGTTPAEPLKYYLKGDSFIDESTFNRTLINSNVALDTNIKKYGSSSFYFNGNTDCFLDIPSDDILLNDSYCLEMWFYPISVSGQLLTLGNAITGIYLYLTGFYLSDNFDVSHSFTANTWHHLAITKNSNNETIAYVNGVSVAVFTDDISFYSNIHRLGNDKIYFDGFNGYIDSIRLETGTPKYTANFNPETDTNLAY